MRLFDLHNDIMTSLLALDEKKRHMQSFAREENDIIYAIWATKLDCEKFREYAKFLCDNSFMFAIEDAGAVGMCLLDNPPPNFMYCSLTWNEDNVYAGGAFGNGNLTPVGKAFIDKLN